MLTVYLLQGVAMYFVSFHRKVANPNIEATKSLNEKSDGCKEDPSEVLFPHGHHPYSVHDYGRWSNCSECFRTSLRLV